MPRKRHKPGPKPGPDGPRLRLGLRGPYVANSTLRTLNAWREAYGVPWGRSIDALLTHAHAHPGFRLPIPARKSPALPVSSPVEAVPATA